MDEADGLCEVRGEKWGMSRTGKNPGDPIAFGDIVQYVGSRVEANA